MLRRIIGLSIPYFAGAAILAVTISAATAQLAVGVAARVNSELITSHELEQRTRLALISARMGDSPISRDRARQAILDKLISERLKLREAQRNGVTVSSDDIDRYVGRVEATQRITPGSWRELLLMAGIDPTFAEDQIRANTAWLKFLEQRLNRQGGVNDQEVAIALKGLTSAAERRRIQLAEIVLTADTTDIDSARRVFIDWLLEHLRGGASFPVSALHFSQAASAADGGNLGCVAAGLLEAPIFDSMLRLGGRTVSDPIRSADEWHIMQVMRGSTGACSQEPDELRVHVVELQLPLASDAPLVEIERQADAARAVMAQVRTCEDLHANGKRIEGAKVRHVENLRPGLLPPHMREALSTSPLGSTAGPYRLPDTVQVLAICSRSGSVNPSVQHTELKTALRQLRIGKESRKVLSDLRRSATIEIAKR